MRQYVKILLLAICLILLLGTAALIVGSHHEIREEQIVSATILTKELADSKNGKSVVLSSKPFDYIIVIEGEEKKLTGNLYFLEKPNREGGEPIRLWQEFVGPVSPQETPRNFFLALDKKEEELALAYVQGFTVRFHQVPLEEGVVPLEDRRPSGRPGEMALIVEDPSVIALPKLVGKEHKDLHELVDNPPEITEVQWVNGSWLVRVATAGSNFAFRYDEQKETWLVEPSFGQ